MVNSYINFYLLCTPLETGRSKGTECVEPFCQRLVHQPHGN